MLARRLLLARGPLLVVEHNNKGILASSLSALTAARHLGEVTALVAGKGVGGVAAEVAKQKGVTKVIHVDSEEYQHALPEALAKLIQKVATDIQATHVVACHTAFGRSCVPRAAALADCQPISDVLAVKSADTFVRSIYAGSAIATVKSTKDAIKFLTIRQTAFGKSTEVSASPAAVESHPGLGPNPKSKWVTDVVADTGKPELTSARVVVSGGRGLKNGENFKLLYDLADKLGGAVGATRAVVDAGYVSSEMQIGQTGKVVAPDLYIAVGLSGAIQHLAGMKDSKVICCINTDPDAPIFTVADYGLVGDLFEVVPKMTLLL